MKFAKLLRVNLTAKDLSDTASDTADTSATDADTSERRIRALTL